MRPILPIDMAWAARYLMCVPPSARRLACDTLFDRAHWADKYRKRFGRPHLYGTGTIASALAYEAMPPEPFGNDANYAHAVLVVCQTILERQNR